MSPRWLIACALPSRWNAAARVSANRAQSVGVRDARSMSSSSSERWPRPARRDQCSGLDDFDGGRRWGVGHQCDDSDSCAPCACTQRLARGGTEDSHRLRGLSSAARSAWPRPARRIARRRERSRRACHECVPAASTWVSWCSRNSRSSGWMRDVADRASGAEQAQASARRRGRRRRRCPSIGVIGR